MDSFNALFHMTPWTKAFVFITSWLKEDVEDELQCEYFLILVIEKQKEIQRRGKRIVYSQHALKLVSPDAKPEDYIELGFKETISVATIELAALLTDRFCSEGSSGFPDPRCKIAMEMPVLVPASLAFLARNFPDEEEISFIYRTRSKELQKYLKDITLVKQNIRFYSLN